MRDFLERHLNSSLLVAALLGQLFFLAYQIKKENEVRLIRLWAVAVIAPVENGIRELVTAAGTLVDDYVALYNARQESHELRAELDQARLRLHELEARAAEADRLAALLDLKEAGTLEPLLAVQVIGASPAASTRTVLIDRGQEAGLGVNMPVLTPDGVVGKIVTVFPRAAQVLLITDRKSGVGVWLRGTELQGVVKGTGSPECRLEYIPNEATVEPGTELISSGQDQLFPKGLPVGRVKTVRPGDFFQEITVEPAAGLEQLEHVLVLTSAPPVLGTAAQDRRRGPAAQP